MADIEKLVDQLSALTVLEAADLAKALEENGALAPLLLLLLPAPPLLLHLLLKSRLNSTLS